MTNIVELSDRAYEKLQRVAEKSGVSPSEWLEARLPELEEPPGRSRSVAEALAPYIGTVDSSKHKPDLKYRNAFGDIVDEKMAKQGFKRPEWPR